ncbi:MAG: hypothetical protein ABIG63_09065 [Chloroflexota bacterium]
MDEAAVERLIALAQEMRDYVPDYFRKRWRIDEELEELCQILRGNECRSESAARAGKNVT